MLLTVKQLAELEGVSINAVRHWIREHKLPIYRIGSRIMIHLELFKVWLKEKETIIEPLEKFIPPEPYIPKSKAAAKMKKIY